MALGTLNWPVVRAFAVLGPRRAASGTGGRKGGGVSREHGPAGPVRRCFPCPVGGRLAEGDSSLWAAPGARAQTPRGDRSARPSAGRSAAAPRRAAERSGDAARRPSQRPPAQRRGRAFVGELAE